MSVNGGSAEFFYLGKAETVGAGQMLAEAVMVNAVAAVVADQERPQRADAQPSHLGGVGQTG